MSNDIAPGSTYHPTAAPDKAAQKRTKERAERAWEEHKHGNQMTLQQAIAEVEQERWYAEHGATESKDAEAA